MAFSLRGIARSLVRDVLLVQMDSRTAVATLEGFSTQLNKIHPVMRKTMMYELNTKNDNHRKRF